VSVAASGRALLAENAGVGAIFSSGELEPGVRGVAAAVVDADGRPIASIAVVAPEHRFPRDDAEAAAAVRASAERISQALARAAPGRRPAPSLHAHRGGRDAPLPAGR
jgi:DNA-binding IclR family transcriptional regulator